MLLVEWSRFLLYQVSIQTAMSRRAWSRVPQRRRDISSCSRVEKNDSAAVRWDPDLSPRVVGLNPQGCEDDHNEEEQAYP